MKSLKALKDDLENIRSDIRRCEWELDELEEERDQLLEEIERFAEVENLEPVILAALNANYNRWCSRTYLLKTVCWADTAYNDEDEAEKISIAVAACEVLAEKGIIQRKEVGRDNEKDPIFDYRITDTETRDMFEESEPDSRENVR